MIIKKKSKNNNLESKLLLTSINVGIPPVVIPFNLY